MPLSMSVCLAQQVWSNAQHAAEAAFLFVDAFVVVCGGFSHPAGGLGALSAVTVFDASAGAIAGTPDDAV